MGYCTVHYGIYRVYFCGDCSVFCSYVHSIGDDDVMTEKAIVFMFIMGCATTLALMGMYILYKIETRD